MHQLAEALSFLHEHRAIHRDLAARIVLVFQLESNWQTSAVSLELNISSGTAGTWFDFDGLDSTVSTQYNISILISVISIHIFYILHLFGC